MARVHTQRPASKAPAASRHKAAHRKKTSYKVVLEEVSEKKKLKTFLSFNPVAPAGYTFIPAGDPQLTNRCKKISRELDSTVYIVSTSNPKNRGLSQEVHRVGYHFSSVVVERSCLSLGVTLTESGRVAQSSFAALNEDFLGRKPKSKSKRKGRDSPKFDLSMSQATIDTQAREAITDLFPKIPPGDLHDIVARSFQKGRDLVGTSSDLSLVRRAHLAVVAHVRHTYTDYDQLLRSVPWAAARRMVESGTLDKIVEWRGDDDAESDMMHDVLREVIVISDDEDDDDRDEEQAENNVLMEQPRRSRRDSVEVISVESLHTQPLQLSHDDIQDTENEGSIQYLYSTRNTSSSQQTFHSRNYMADRIQRWDDAVRRQKSNKNPSSISESVSSRLEYPRTLASDGPDTNGYRIAERSEQEHPAAPFVDESYATLQRPLAIRPNRIQENIIPEEHTRMYKQTPQRRGDHYLDLNSMRLDPDDTLRESDIVVPIHVEDGTTISHDRRVPFDARNQLPHRDVIRYPSNERVLPSVEDDSQETNRPPFEEGPSYLQSRGRHYSFGAPTSHKLNDRAHPSELGELHSYKQLQNPEHVPRKRLKVVSASENRHAVAYAPLKMVDSIMPTARETFYNLEPVHNERAPRIIQLSAGRSEPEVSSTSRRMQASSLTPRPIGGRSTRYGESFPQQNSHAHLIAGQNGSYPVSEEPRIAAAGTSRQVYSDPFVSDHASRRTHVYDVMEERRPDHTSISAPRSSSSIVYLPEGIHHDPMAGEIRTPPGLPTPHGRPRPEYLQEEQVYVVDESPQRPERRQQIYHPLSEEKRMSAPIVLVRRAGERAPVSSSHAQIPYAEEEAQEWLPLQPARAEYVQRGKTRDLIVLD